MRRAYQKGGKVEGSIWHEKDAYGDGGHIPVGDPRREENLAQWNEGNALVDKQGNPLRLYRGAVSSPKLPEGFLQGKTNRTYATFTSTNPYVAGTYAHPNHKFDPHEVGGVMAIHAHAHKLHEFPSKDGRFDMFAFDDFARNLPKGHAVVVRGVVDSGPRGSLKTDPEMKFSYPSDVYAWNEANSVKSATGNNGHFDPSNPDITKSGGGSVEKDTAIHKGKPFWSGVFDAHDGFIREVHPYKRAKAADFHHSYYVSPQSQDAMRQGDAGFFWVDPNGSVNTDWREGKAPQHIEDAIRSQIQPIHKDKGGDVEAYGRGGSSEDDIIRQRLAAIPSIDHPDPIMREKALAIAQGTHRLNPLYETGEKNKRIGHSFYTYKGGQEDPSNVQSTVIPIPGATPLTPKKMSYEEFYKQGQGGTFINLGGDRSRLGRLTHIDNKQLAWPVDLHAGPQYMLEPNKGAVWANAAGQTTRNRNIIEPLLKKGPVYGMYAPMGPLTVDSSFQMTDAIMSQIGARKLDKKAAKAFDENIKKANFVGGKRPEDIENRKKIAEAMKGWPGINNAWEAKEYLKKIPGTIRSLIVKDLDRSDWQQMGFPHIGKTRVAITDPDLLKVGGNMIGHRVVQLSPDSVMPTAFKHNTYPEETAGTYVGDVPLVQRHYALPEAINQFAAEPHKPGVLHPYSENPNAQGGFKKMTEDQKVIQNIDQPWLESVQQGLANQKKYGFKKGGIAKTTSTIHNSPIVEHALGKVSAALPALDLPLMAAKAGRRY